MSDNEDDKDVTGSTAAEEGNLLAAFYSGEYDDDDESEGAITAYL